MKRILILLSMLLVFAVACDDTEEEPQALEVIDVEVSINPIIHDDGELTIGGETNIPDGGELMIGIGNKEADYQASSKATITDGTFESDTYSRDGDSLSEGDYSVSISLSIASTQDGEFVEKVGEDYGTLAGDLMDDSGIGKTMKYKTEITVD